MLAPLWSSKRAGGVPAGSVLRLALARMRALCLRSMSRDADMATRLPTPLPSVSVRLSAFAASTAAQDVPDDVVFSRTPIAPVAKPTPGDAGDDEKSRRPAPPSFSEHALPPLRTCGDPESVLSALTRRTVFAAPVSSASHDVT